MVKRFVEEKKIGWMVIQLRKKIEDLVKSTTSGIRA